MTPLPPATPKPLTESQKATLAAGMASHEAQKAASARLRYLETQATTVAEAELRLLRIAEGCHDYGGGHHRDGMMDAYQHGISTVVSALTAALKHDPNDHQVNTLEVIGASSLSPLPAQAAKDGQ